MNIADFRSFHSLMSSPAGRSQEHLERLLAIALQAKEGINAEVLELQSALTYFNSILRDISIRLASMIRYPEEITDLNCLWTMNKIRFLERGFQSHTYDLSLAQYWKLRKVNLSDSDRKTFLDNAVDVNTSGGAKYFLTACRKGNKKFADFLLEIGFDLGSIDPRSLEIEDLQSVLDFGVSGEEESLHRHLCKSDDKTWKRRRDAALALFLQGYDSPTLRSNVEELMTGLTANIESFRKEFPQKEEICAKLSSLNCLNRVPPNLFPIIAGFASTQINSRVRDYCIQQLLDRNIVALPPSLNQLTDLRERVKACLDRAYHMNQEINNRLWKASDEYKREQEKSSLLAGKLMGH